MHHCIPKFTNMKLSRLFQPRNPFFWILIAMNALSAVFGWIAHTWPLHTIGALLIAVLALSNAFAGMWLAWRLVRDEPGGVGS
jgi:uncharacterized membrane protein HdeD (DUF308 family)